MSVPIKFFTVMVREAVADEKLRGGAPMLVAQLKGVIEEGLIRWVFMSPGDVSDHMKRLQKRGLTPPQSGPHADIALLDMRGGLMAPCAWLEVTGGFGESKRAQLIANHAEPPGKCCDEPEILNAASRARRAPPPALDELLEYVRQDNRVCPMPRPWHDFWKLISASANEGDGPPLPLVLSVWYLASDARKRECLREQIHWANRNGFLEVADAYLRGLSADQWLERSAQDDPGERTSESWSDGK